VLVSGFIVGILLLTLGRKLFWLFVGGSGFVVAFFLTGELLPGQPTWVFLLVALVAGLLGAWLAVRLQWLAVGVGGFLGGGYIAAVFVESLNLSLGGPEWLPAVVGGVIGAILLGALFNPALIVLSSLVGATLVADSLPLGSDSSIVVMVVAAVLGIMVQSHMFRKGEKE
jgi:hypothetical protein